MRWTAAVKGIRRAHVRLRIRLADIPLDTSRLGRGAAALYLAGLSIVLTTAWHAPAGTGGDAIALFPAWHLGFLMATGAGMALLTLGRREADGEEGEPEPPSAGMRQLMAQMSHELRTPLNAVIGFSDVMLAELHGPLGNARYQEYAHHISESGGRLLKSSEQALAVTEAMSALMADRRAGRRERLVAGTLARDAWRAATSAAGTAPPRLALTTCTTCDILCERRPTVQALEHLFREAQDRVPAGGGVEVIGKRQGGRRSVTIRVERGSDPSPQRAENSITQCREGSDPDARLRVILARLLLEVQGATLACHIGEDGCWTAHIEFAGRS
jgi:signal transduction histidine kinase